MGGQCLSNGKLYHKNCYEVLLSDIKDKTIKLSELKVEIMILKNNIENEASFVKRIILRLHGEKYDINSLQSKINEINQAIYKLSYENDRKLKVRDYLYDYWPTYPPDWEERKDRIERYSERRCNKCNSYQRLHIHHKIPIYKGGSHRIENLLLLCEKCHRKEHGGREFYYFDERENSAFSKRIKTLYQAISEDKLVRFKYINYERSESIRTINPMELKEIGRTLCVDGYCYLREENRTFAIKRMRELKIVSNPGKSYRKRS